MAGLNKERLGVAEGTEPFSRANSLQSFCCSSSSKCGFGLFLIAFFFFPQKEHKLHVFCVLAAVTE